MDYHFYYQYHHYYHYHVNVIVIVIAIFIFNYFFLLYSLHGLNFKLLECIPAHMPSSCVQAELYPGPNPTWSTYTARPSLLFIH